MSYPHILRLHPKERTYFCLRHRNRFLTNIRLPMGARYSPSCWGGLVALVSRLTVHMFDEDEADLQCSVDDPILTLGAEEEGLRELHASAWVLSWRVLNVPMAYKKGQFGASVQWIGGTIAPNDSEVTISVKPETLDELEVQIQEMRAGPNLTKIALLRSLAGRGNFISGLVPTWCFFLQQISS